MILGTASGGKGEVIEKILLVTLLLPVLGVPVVVLGWGMASEVVSFNHNVGMTVPETCRG